MALMEASSTSVIVENLGCAIARHHQWRTAAEHAQHAHTNIVAAGLVFDRELPSNDLSMALAS